MALSDREAALAKYLDASAGRPLVYGDWDCAVGFLAGWVLQVRGVDPGAGWRGRYSTRLGWMRMVKRRGGLLAVLRQAATDIGLVECGDASPGDCGAVQLRSVDGWREPMGAIATGLGWAVLTPAGLLITPAATTVVWKL